MTRLLALDTAIWWAGIALVESDESGERVLAELGIAIDGSHAGALLSRVDRLLETAGLTRDQIDGFVAVRGPGAFTGVRIGLGTMRGWGVATGRPCFGVNGLAALVAAAGPRSVERLAVMEAGRNELYAARFDADGDPPTLGVDTCLVRRDELASGCGESPAIVVPAPGTSIERGGLPAGWGLAAAPRAIAASAGLLALAAHAGRLDDRRIVQRDEEIAPLYVRVPDVLLKRSAR